MPELEAIGRLLLLAGIVIAIIGAILAFGVRIPFLGQLPGDMRIERDGATVFIPLGTMVVVSIILSVALGLLGRR